MVVGFGERLGDVRPRSEAASVTNSHDHHSEAVMPMPAMLSVKHVPSLLKAWPNEMPGQARLSDERQA